MGSGAPRELGSVREKRSVDPEMGRKLSVALDKLDTLDATFKQARADESNSQLTKTWSDVSKAISSHLEDICTTLINSHQISLEVGSEGGGQGATPWCEEGGAAFPRLEFRLKDGKIICFSDGNKLAQGDAVREVPYEWVQGVVIRWIILGVQAKAG